jgi:hypothetical protein
MKKILLAVVALGILAGCQPANISAVMRGTEHDSNMETRCEPTDMRDKTELKQVLSSYDGWRMIYASEFTTGNRFGTVGVICFERQRKL